MQKGINNSNISLMFSELLDILKAMPSINTNTGLREVIQSIKEFERLLETFHSNEFIVIDSLFSNSRKDALSANQGKVLNSKIEYTRREVKQLIELIEELIKIQAGYTDEEIDAMFEVVNNAIYGITTNIIEINKCLTSVNKAITSINASLLNKANIDDVYTKKEIVEMFNKLYEEFQNLEDRYNNEIQYVNDAVDNCLEAVANLNISITEVNVRLYKLVNEIKTKVSQEVFDLFKTEITTQLIDGLELKADKATIYTKDEITTILGDYALVVDVNIISNIINDLVPRVAKLETDVVDLTVEVDKKADKAYTNPGYPSIATIYDALDQALYYDLSIVLNFSSSTLREIGDVLSSQYLSWTYNKPDKMLKSQSVNGKSLPISDRLYDIPGNITTNTTYTLLANDTGNKSFSKAVTVTFTNGVFYGSKPIPGNYDSAFVNTLTKKLNTNRNITFTVNAKAGEFIYFAIPISYGNAVFNIGGFDTEFEVVKEFAYTNILGYTNQYRIYKSGQSGLGDTTVIVK